MAKLTRRTLVQGSFALGSGVAAAGPGTMRAGAATPVAGATAVAAASPRLDPTTIPKYEAALVVPPGMPQSTPERVPGDESADVDYYEIAVRQFAQQILPASMGLKTTVWGYGAVDHPETFNYPAFTIEATIDRPVRVVWINDLVDENGTYRPHLLPVDPTLHWPNLANMPATIPQKTEIPEL